MDYGGDERCRRRYRQPDKTLFVHLRCAFGQNTRTRRLYVEARQAKGPAHQVHEGEKPGKLVRVAAFLQGRSVSPGVGQHGRGQAEGHDIRYRVELDAYLSGRPGHTRYTPVQRIEEKGPADGFRRRVEIA